MDIDEMKRILYLLALLALAGCGGTEGFDGSGIAVRVSSAKSFDPLISHGQVKLYRVTVTGEGIDGPIVAEFAGDATEGVIEDIPTGDDRTVEVEAINPNDVRILAGEAYGVEVGGGITEVPVALEAVPIFTNIASGNTVENTRLVFKLFSDPTNPVIVEEMGGGGASPMIDAATNLAELYLDQSTGNGWLAPALLEPGKRMFVVRDLVTGRSNQVAVRVVDGTGMKPAPFVTAATVGSELQSCVAPICAP